VAKTKGATTIIALPMPALLIKEGPRITAKMRSTKKIKIGTIK
jgi:hypothetical protein